MSNINVDDLISQAEKSLAAMLGDAQEENLLQKQSHDPVNHEGKNSDYQPELETGSIYDSNYAEYQLSDFAIESALESDDVEPESVDGFINAIEVDSNEEIAHLSLTTTSGNQFSIGGGAKEDPTANLADINQIIDFAVNRFQAIQNSQNAGKDSTDAVDAGDSGQHVISVASDEITAGSPTDELKTEVVTKLTVYHGSNNHELAELTPLNFYNSGMFGKGINFTSSLEDARKYASSNVIVNPDIISKADILARELHIPYDDAKAELTKGNGRVYEAKLTFLKPLVIGSKQLDVPLKIFRMAAIEAGYPVEKIDSLHNQFMMSSTGEQQFELLLKNNATTIYRQIALLKNNDVLVIESSVAPKANGATHYLALDGSQVTELKGLDVAPLDSDVAPEIEEFNTSLNQQESSEMQVPDPVEDLPDLDNRNANNDLVSINTGQQVVEAQADSDLPDGIMHLSENHTFFSNSGVELSVFPKEYKKEITTATKRVEWFIEQIEKHDEKNSELLTLMRELQSDPVTNYGVIFKMGCEKLFGNSFGVPIENRKKKIQELKAEKERAEIEAREALIAKAKSRIKSADEIAEINAEHSKIKSILNQVMERPLLSVEEIFSKPEKGQIEPFSDREMMNKTKPSITLPQEENVAITPIHYDSYFVILRGKERLAMGNGKYLSVDQINSIAKAENAIVVWAANESLLDDSIQKLTGNVSENSANKESDSVKENLKPSQNLTELAKVNVFEQEVEKAIGSIKERIEIKTMLNEVDRKHASLREEKHTTEQPIHAPKLAPVVVSNSQATTQSQTNSEKDLGVENLRNLPGAVKEKIEVILKAMESKRDSGADCAFYRVKQVDSTTAVIALSKNVNTGQVKFYEISIDGKLVLNPQMTKVDLARMIAQQKISEIEVEALQDRQIDTHIQADNNLSEPKQSSSLGMS